MSNVREKSTLHNRKNALEALQWLKNSLFQAGLEHDWTQIIPNSQLVVIPFPKENPAKWVGIYDAYAYFDILNIYPDLKS